MILDEYDEKFHIANEKKLSYEQGIAKGRALEKEQADKTIREEKQRADNAIQEEKQRADKTILLFKNVLQLHFKQLPDEAIAKELNISINTVQAILKEADLDITGSRI